MDTAISSTAIREDAPLASLLRPGWRPQPRLLTVLGYALVSAETGKAVELFVRREAARQMLAEALADEPDWRDDLSVQEVDLGAGELEPLLSSRRVATPTGKPLRALRGGASR